MNSDTADLNESPVSCVRTAWAEALSYAHNKSLSSYLRSSLCSSACAPEGSRAREAHVEHRASLYLQTVTVALEIWSDNGGAGHVTQCDLVIICSGDHVIYLEKDCERALDNINYKNMREMLQQMLPLLFRVKRNPSCKENAVTEHLIDLNI